MAIDSDVDIEVTCDDCGCSENVDVTNAVLERIKNRGWKCSVADGEICPECASKQTERS